MGELSDKELAELFNAARTLNVNEFLRRGPELIGPLYRAADYSMWKWSDTFTQYQWAALTLGLEPNQKNPSLGPIPFRRPIAEDWVRQRLCSFDFIVELMESSCRANKLEPVLKPTNRAALAIEGY